MVRLFQTQLEHYEKVEGTRLSLEGKANQLGQMVSGEPADGDAGPRRHSAVRRLRPAPEERAHLHLRRHRRAVRGDRLPRHRLGRPRRQEHDQARLPRAASARDEAVELAVAALYEAADEDTATGGPDPLRGIYPVVATVDADGYRRLGDDEVAERFQAVLDAAARAIRRR